MRRLIALLAALLIPTLQQKAFGETLLPPITKTPFEQFNCSVDFTPVIGVDGINLVSVTAQINSINYPAVIASVPVPAVVPNTDIVVFRVQGGTLGTVYTLSVKASDATNGQQWEGTIPLAVTMQ